METKSFTILKILALVFVFLVISFRTTVAQSPHKLVRLSLVHLYATGIARSGPQMSNEVSSLGTGFFVSVDGLILTTRHLVGKLGDIDGSSLRIFARIGEKTADARPAAFVDSLEMTDLMLLKIPPGISPFNPVVLGNANRHPAGDPIYTSGFPVSISYRTQQGNIEAREGPSGYLWATNIKFEAGQSGSPIYDKKGAVIGLVKGARGSLNFMIPIEFADGLLAQVRLRDISRQLRKIQKRIEALEGR